MSRIGRMPIVIPKDVKISFDGSKVEVTGQRGGSRNLSPLGLLCLWIKTRS